MLKQNLGLVMGKTEPMENSENWTNRKFISPVFCWYEMVAIFQFFHNGWCWYFISVNTRKTRDPNFGESVIWNFSVWSIFMKWQPFFNFFIMANADIPFPSTLGKPETQTLGGASNLKFFHTIDIYKMVAIFQFFHNSQHWYSISVNTRKIRDLNFRGGQ